MLDAVIHALNSLGYYQSFFFGFFLFFHLLIFRRVDSGYEGCLSPLES